MLRWWLIASCLFLFFDHRADAKAYLVGDEHHWDLGVDYGQWASKYSFVMNQDSLVFLYDPRQHSVLQVSQGDFDVCNIHNPITTLGPNTAFAISSPKAYFICGIPGHCVSNLKLAISATASSIASRNITARAPETSSSPTSLQVDALVVLVLLSLLLKLTP